MFGVNKQLPPDCDKVQVLFQANDDKVQAVVVRVNDTHDRPDGGTYHITVSTNPDSGGKPVHSNDLLRDYDAWDKVDPFWIDVVPAFIPFN